MKKIGIISFSKTNHRFMLSVAKKLAKFNKINFFVCFDTKKFIKNKNIKFVKVFFHEKKSSNKKIILQNKVNPDDAKNFKNRSFIQGLIKIKNFIYFFVYIIRRYLYSYIKYFYNKVDILISPGDRENIFELSLLKFAENDKKKIFIYPSAVAADPINSVFYREKHVVENVNFIKKFPKQIFKYKKKNYSFFGFNHTIIFNFLGILPLNPWTFAAGKNRKLILTSSALVDYYKNLGTPKKNIKLIKNEKYERNFYTYKKYKDQYVLFKKINRLDNRKPILFINLPNWFEHKVISRKEAFARYKDLFLHLNSKKIDKKYNLIISLHPQQNFYTYKKFLKKYNVTLMKEKFDNLLQYIDGVISLAGSSILIDCKDLNIPYFLFNMYKNESMNKLYFRNLKKKQIIENYKNLDTKLLKEFINLNKKKHFIFNKKLKNFEYLVSNN